MAPTGGGRGKRGGGAGRRRGEGGDEGGDASPEWLPPQQRQELETRRATRSSAAARRERAGPTQDFLDRIGAEVQRAGGQAAQPAGGAEGVDEEGGEEDEEGRERIAMQLHRQEGNLWAPGPNVGVRVLPGGGGGGGGGGEGGEGAEAVEEEVQAPDLATQPPQELPERAELPSLETLHSTLVPTLKWCPKAARGDFAREVSSLWQRLVQHPEDARLWVLEAMFARCILPAGRGPRAGDAYSQARLVRERLRRWRVGEHGQLWQEAVELTKVPPRKAKKGQEQEKPQEKRNAERATTLTQDGQFTKALQALTSAGMALPNRANLKVMKEKHPQATGDQLIPPTTDLPQLSFSQVEVRVYQNA